MNLEPTVEEVEKRLAAGELEPSRVETRPAFDEAMEELFTTGRPREVPSAEALDEWGWGDFDDHVEHGPQVFVPRCSGDETRSAVCHQFSC